MVREKSALVLFLAEILLAEVLPIANFDTYASFPSHITTGEPYFNNWRMTLQFCIKFCPCAQNLIRRISVLNFPKDPVSAHLQIHGVNPNQTKLFWH